MTPKELTDRLSQLAEGLLFPSESDYPLEPFTWESATISPETILTRSQKPADTAIESITLEDFFAPVVTDEDWFEDEDRAITQRFRDLQAAIATLENVQVFRLGKIEIDVYIVGAIGADVVGLKTTVIET
ncbi:MULTISPECIES: nuclease A inhibitor family protein [Pseudanabaena]|uniref:nuclease A inhibitor family protein n=1 Tax=Pseudanabaena TaxID=1152 RepID=UPI002478BA2E|nr:MULTISPECIES: nuclease A inhibitor family protein [Pseudanabaena]MEA5490302.1 nuclease A inhibitor family protein [Pseudanabaena sp. CCNP1317]WGS74069.1 nuclease A inhibitor family protein [Pseudanabaena galeata CCNP1313]